MANGQVAMSALRFLVLMRVVRARLGGRLAFFGSRNCIIQLLDSADIWVILVSLLCWMLRFLRVKKRSVSFAGGRGSSEWIASAIENPNSDSRPSRVGDWARFIGAESPTLPEDFCGSYIAFVIHLLNPTAWSGREMGALSHSLFIRLILPYC